MSNNKYITFAARKDGLDFCSFVRFNEHMVHADVAHMMIPCVAMSYSCTIDQVVILGAGFVHDGILGAECYGESDSLKIDSRKSEDSEILNYFASTLILDAPEVEDESTGSKTDADNETAHEASAPESRQESA